MPFVHSLVRTRENGKTGWCAPVELAEAAPHYVSFVVPLDPDGSFFGAYTCESVVTTGRAKRVERHELVGYTKNSMVLRLNGMELWFSLKPVAKEDRRLPYVGKLGHADFQYLLTEIEPEQPEKLDMLYDEAHTLIVGCEPFRHYAGIRKLERT